jgi:hypothetical protein
LETPDEKYTMRFDDIGEEPIHFCSSCGELAQQMLQILEKATKEQGPEFLLKLDDAVTKAEQEQRSKQS